LRIIRPEIQYLRAVAVAVVVVFHLWPARLGGGYIGVDVFFVISGYLITSHLLRELVQTNRVDFAAFYARRIQRIFPAALVVLSATIALSAVFLPLDKLFSTLSHVIASALFVENWTLAANSVDYQAQTEDASLVQHYWSLSVEEQFYLLWPVFIAIIWLISRKTTRSSQKFIVVALVSIVLTSLLCSVLLTAHDKAPAYFMTWNRVWEFAAGGLLAHRGTASKSTRSSVRVPLSIVGWLLILCSAYLFTSTTPFPGYLALIPVVGTLLVIWSGVNPSIPRLFDRAVFFVAEISFAIYLWHWPLIVVAQAISPHELGSRSKIVIAVITVLLAWLTTRYVEQPVRFRLLHDWRPAKVLLLGLLSVLTVAVVAALMMFLTARFESQLSSATTSSSPLPILAADDKAQVYSDHCNSEVRAVMLRQCAYGDETSEIRVALIGDSHAMAISPILIDIAETNNWSLSTFLKDGCPFFVGPTTDAMSVAQQSCVAWNSAVQVELADSKKFDYVFVTWSAGRKVVGTTRSVALNNFRDAWAPLRANGTKIFVVRDVPRMDGALDCLIADPANPAKCAVPRSVAYKKDWMVAAAADQDSVFVIDFFDTMCPKEMCQIVIDGITTYRDAHHLTNTFAQYLIPTFVTELGKEYPQIFQ
jgi:peptidoglycan/LPS O-acetylase OafA/YrhL